MRVVLDSSALLALILGERGAEVVGNMIEGAIIGAVNLSEAVSRLVDLGWASDDIGRHLSDFGLDVIAFGEETANSAGFLRASTRRHGLSLGDRACLALAIAEGARVVTADRAWGGLDLGVEIEVIR